MSAFLAGLGGFAGGFVGNPADLVNVRMQNDVKLPPEQRRKYDIMTLNNNLQMHPTVQVKNLLKIQ